VAEVDTLYAKLLGDPRHTDLLLLSSDDDVRERLFPDWAMRAVDLDSETGTRLEPLRTMLEAVVAQRRIQEQLVGSLERALWRELVDSR
jgi:hypothetical protein